MKIVCDFFCDFFECIFRSQNQGILRELFFDLNIFNSFNFLNFCDFSYLGRYPLQKLKMKNLEVTRSQGHIIVQVTKSQSHKKGSLFYESM